MRIRATAAAAVVSGALALTAALMPAAQAAGISRNRPVQAWQQVERLRAAQARARPAAAASGPVRTDAARAGADGPQPLAVAFSDVEVDGGRTGVAVGTTDTVHVPYTFTLTASATGAAPVDVSSTGFFTGVDLYRGSAADPANDLSGDDAPTCRVTSSTRSTGSTTGLVTTESCQGSIDVHPQDELQVADAGAGWHAVVWAMDLNGQDPGSKDFDPDKTGEAERTGLAAPAVQRHSRLTVNASPEPVAKGRTVTVTGSLTRANWDTHTYAGYTVQPVRLQFREKGGSAYTTLKTVTTDGHGNLRTTFKASADGYWRYSFAGTPTTPAVSAAGDYVEVG